MWALLPVGKRPLSGPVLPMKRRGRRRPCTLAARELTDDHPPQGRRSSPPARSAKARTEGPTVSSERTQFCMSVRRPGWSVVERCPRVRPAGFDGEWGHLRDGLVPTRACRSHRFAAEPDRLVVTSRVVPTTCHPACHRAEVPGCVICAPVMGPSVCFVDPTRPGAAHYCPALALEGAWRMTGIGSSDLAEQPYSPSADTPVPYRPVDNAGRAGQA